MEYDPIKNKFGKFFRRNVRLQIIFYKLLDLILLRAWHIHRELKQWAKDQSGHKHVMDAGSGFGQYTYWMAENHPEWSIFSVDVNPVQVCTNNEIFRKIHFENVIFKTTDLTIFQQPSSFDLILCVDVMEHIEEDVKVFENYNVSLKQGGILLISTPSDQGGSDVTKEGEESFIGEHVRDGYNINEIKEKLKTAGFTKVKARYSYGIPGQISWRLSMKYPMMMLNFSFLFIIILPLYYLITFPFSLLLNYIDTHTGHTSGTGLIVKAWK
jgi:2-polyprenyl-3-methyl-5-hydroxy-6-metoxy-1,4-benzoquinol methylase